jgi:hypothetical protein
MDYCHNCGVSYDREFDYEDTFEYLWVPRCACLEENRLLDDFIWENSG